MTSMKQQVATSEGWTSAEAAQLMRSFSRPAQSLPIPGQQACDRHAVLTRTVKDEVIPRLVLARRPQQATVAAVVSARPDSGQVERLVTMVLEGDQDEASAYVGAMSDNGTPTESLFLDLLTPTARRLGEMWEDDSCSFTDVTLGLIRLGNVMHLLSHAFSDDHASVRSGPSVLLAQVPGEQHGFGLAMVVQFFRRAGWNVRQESAPSREQLCGIVQEQWFGLIGLSVACSDRMDQLVADIRAVRRASRNPAIGVMVGGPPFVAHPQLAAMVGADATAIDGLQAVRQAQGLVSLLARER